MFEDAKLKHAWACEHMQELRAEIDNFIQKNRHAIVIETDSDTGDTAITVSFKDPIPPAIPLWIGDAAHNLKTALDYALWELIGLDRGRQHSQLYMPSGDDQKSYEGLCKGISTPRADTKEFLVGLRNHGGPGGKVFLRALHLLDRKEKHTVLTPLAGASRIPHLKIKNSEGVVIEETKNCSFLMEEDGRTHIKVGRGNAVELFEQADTTIEIFLAEFPPMPGPQPALPMLNFMANAVAETLAMFEEFVAARDK